MQTAFFPQHAQQPQGAQAGAAFQGKRKRNSWLMEDYEYEQNKQARVRSPALDRRTTFPLSNAHSHHSHSADSSDDQEMDMETHMGMGMSASNGNGHADHLNQVAGYAPMQRDPAHAHSMHFGQEAPVQMQVQVPQPQYQRDAQAHNYNYGFEGSGGSGGFGFGPGADDDEISDEEQPHTSNLMYPSFTPHPNPNHFSHSHIPGFPTTVRPKSPLSAQPFSTSLRPSGQAFAAEPSNGFGAGFGAGAGMGFADLANSAGHLTAQAIHSGAQPQVGIIQPQNAEPLQWGANAVEQARAVHGPQCTSIPKLVLSQYPDPVTGKQSMWAQCRDCGAVERSS